MSTSDPIADMLTRIRNAISAKLPRVDVPGSKLKLALAEILRTEGFIRGYKLFDNNKKKNIRIYLKYTQEQIPVINGLKRISKPGRRIYQEVSDIKPIFNNIGISILSTSKGVMTGKNAVQAKVGGEVIAHIW
jgi:small subunit ribosomal protein S8